MTRYVGTPGFVHGSPSRAGVLLVNLGTPGAPTPAAVRRYLAEFLRDPRVVEMPRALWWPVLYGIILWTRPGRSAEAYRRIWTPEGSPLLVQSRALADRLAGRLRHGCGDRVQVALAMTYGGPSIEEGLDRLRRDGIRRLLVLPMYPQYSSTTTAAVFERVSRELAGWRWVPELRMVNDYWDEEAYVAAIADGIAARWRERGRSHLVFSFHSIPRRYLLAGDPYHCHCQATAHRVARRLGLAAGEWTVGFQSRFGREEWLRPAVDELLHGYAHSGPKRVTLVCPGFAVDCLETLEEIDLRYREAFLSHGGESFDYVPCLNAGDAQVALYEQLVLKHAQGWPELTPRDEAAALADARQRALALGAKH